MHHSSTVSYIFPSNKMVSTPHYTLFSACQFDLCSLHNISFISSHSHTLFPHAVVSSDGQRMKAVEAASNLLAHSMLGTNNETRQVLGYTIGHMDSIVHPKGLWILIFIFNIISYIMENTLCIIFRWVIYRVDIRWILVI